jgi:hypothetical protein
MAEWPGNTSSVEWVKGARGEPGAWPCWASEGTLAGGHSGVAQRTFSGAEPGPTAGVGVWVGDFVGFW